MYTLLHLLAGVTGFALIALALVLTDRWKNATGWRRPIPGALLLLAGDGIGFNLLGYAFRPSLEAAMLSSMAEMGMEAGLLPVFYVSLSLAWFGMKGSDAKNRWFRLASWGGWGLGVTLMMGLVLSSGMASSLLP